MMTQFSQRFYEWRRSFALVFSCFFGFFGSPLLLAQESNSELERALLALEQEFNNLSGHEFFDQSFSQLPIDFGSEEFLRNFTQALSASQASEAVDYASNFKHLSASSSFTLGYRQGQHGLKEVLRGESSLGSVGAITAQYGANFAFRFHNEDRSRFNFGFSGASFSDQLLDYSAEGYSVGWQYDLIREKSLAGPLASWRNLRFGLGLRHNHAGMSYRASLGTAKVRASDFVPDASSLSGLEIGLEPSLFLKQDSRAWTVPVELSTAIRFFSFFSVYSLAAIDLSWGKSEGSAWLESPVRLSGGNSALYSQSELSVGGGEHVSTRSKVWELRTLLGSQFDLGYGAVFFQYQALLRSGAQSAALGFRAFY